MQEYMKKYKAAGSVNVRLEYFKKTGEGKLTVLGRGKNKEKVLFSFTHDPSQMDCSLVMIETPLRKRYFSFYTGGPSDFDCWSTGIRITPHKDIVVEMTFCNSKVLCVIP